MTEREQLQEYHEWRNNCLKRGYFFETERTDVINYLIEKNNFVNYLEIGVCDGDNIKRIKAKHIDGVDPGIEGQVAAETNYQITSDSFFELIKGHDIKYDVVFVDGLHHCEQVYKDIINSLNHTVENGYIVCHDMNPRWELSTRRKPSGTCWNGDTWKAWAKLKSERADLKMEVVDTDHGVGIISRGSQQTIDLPDEAFNLQYSFLEDNRNELLELITVGAFYEKYSNVLH